MLEHRVLWLTLAYVVGGCGDDAGSADTGTAPDVTNDVASDDVATAETSAPDVAGPETVAPDDADTTTSEDVADADEVAAADADDAATSVDTTIDVAPDVPVLDPDGDTDRDGILDLDEVDDGTDPFDPSSARAWHPEVEGHPRLFVRPADQPAIALRVTAPEGATAALWARVNDLAGRTPATHPLGGDYDTSIPPGQSNIVEAAALVGFATGDLAMTVKALDVLAAPFPDPTPLNNRSMFNAGDHYDLLEAEALQGFCSAYDLAAGTAGVDAEKLAAARMRLVERIDHFRNLCFTVGGCTALLRNEPNNHAIKALAALGMCAIAIPDRPEAAADFNEALTAIDWLAHTWQGNLEGGWAESWNYLNYSGDTHLGFLAAVHHVTPLVGEAVVDAAGGWRARATGWVTRKNPDNGDDVTVLDPAADPLWRAVYERALFAVMPWGSTPPVDDANPSSLHGGLLAALFDDARFLWNWEQARVGRHTGRQLVATFLGLDPTMAAEAPTWDLDGFFAEAGFSVLRSSLATTASYLHMQHEPRDMRMNGGSHEHADPLSFILAAHGTDLAIDPGYIDFTNHAKVKYGKDHNIVLVDGQGPEFFLDGFFDFPPNSDGFLHGHEAVGPFTTFVASTKYHDAELRRRVVRVDLPGDGDAFVVADRLVSATPRLWSFQLNGLASEEIGNTSFEATPVDAGALARWTRPAATLWTATAAALEVTTTTTSRLEESSLASGRHRCLVVDATMGDGAGFVTVLVPALPEATPELAVSRVGGVARVSATLDDGTIILAELLASDDVRVSVSAPALVSGTWTMVTPAIPDPEPFIPQ